MLGHCVSMLEGNTLHFMACEAMKTISTTLLHNL